MLTAIRPFTHDKEYVPGNEVPGSIDPALKARLINTRFIVEKLPPKGPTQLRVTWPRPFKYGDTTYRVGDVLPDKDMNPRKRLSLIGSGYVDEVEIPKPKAERKPRKAKKRATRRRTRSK